jgi:hypothetical protein
MRIRDGEGKALDKVYLALSDEEAKQLADYLKQMLTEEKGWHAHVSDPSFQVEVTIYREDDETAVF